MNRVAAVELRGMRNGTRVRVSGIVTEASNTDKNDTVVTIDDESGSLVKATLSGDDAAKLAVTGSRLELYGLAAAPVTPSNEPYPLTATSWACVDEIGWEALKFLEIETRKS